MLFLIAVNLISLAVSSNQKDIQPDSVDRNTRFTDVQGVSILKSSLYQNKLTKNGKF